MTPISVEVVCALSSRETPTVFKPLLYCLHFKMIFATTVFIYNHLLSNYCQKTDGQNKFDINIMNGRRFLLLFFKKELHTFS